MALPTTHERVPAHTAEHINQRIQREIAERYALCRCACRDTAATEGT